MSMPFGEFVTYHTAYVSGQDTRGNDIIGYRDSTVGPCAFVPQAQAETTNGSEQVTAQGEYFLPVGTASKPLDRITRPTGETYEITGESGTWTSPFSGRSSPAMVHLKRVTGAGAHSAAGDL